MFEKCIKKESQRMLHDSMKYKRLVIDCLSNEKLKLSDVSLAPTTKHKLTEIMKKEWLIKIVMALLFKGFLCILGVI